MRDAASIREMLLKRLHLCLRVPNMCGGELGLLNLMEYLTFIDERENEWRLHRNALSESNAFRSTGLHGGFCSATGQVKREEIQPASVYALIAYQMGYLTSGHKFDVTRVLSSHEFDSMLTAFDKQFFASELTNHDVIETFGEPSLRWGTNDNYPCVLLYFDDGSPIRFCYFDCWADFYTDVSGCRVPKKYGPKPILRNIRLPAEKFVDQFRFTDFGRQLSAETGE